MNFSESPKLSMLTTQGIQWSPNIVRVLGATKAMFGKLVVLYHSLLHKKTPCVVRTAAGESATAFYQSLESYFERAKILYKSFRGFSLVSFVGQQGVERTRVLTKL